jgi:hypothetical protein
MRKFLVVPLLVCGVLMGASTAGAFTPDVRVSSGSPPGPFSQNKQNEPAMAVDASRPNILAAGSNDEIDIEACNAGTDNTCPFTPNVGVSGIYFSFNSGDTWTQPTYTGLTARDCLGVPGDADPPCTAHNGQIGTIPLYAENGLASDGDPALAFGPRRGANGQFSWSNGSRLYYANLAANTGATRSEQVFKGFEAIAVSRTDDVQRAAANDKTAWMAPVVISRQSSTTFADKEQIWADNASSSPFFGTVYVCWAEFRGQAKGNAAPAPLTVAVSRDGGSTWRERQVGAAANNSQRNPTDGCTIRTDSRGVAYVFGVGTINHQTSELMSRSTDGGTSWSKPSAVVGPVNQPGVFDPVQGRPTIDGMAGARSDLAPAPSIDIANGAPDGSGATDRIVMTYVSGPLATPHVYFTESTDRGGSWTPQRAIETAGDRGFYTAPSISPNGRDVYVVYNAFTTPYRNDTSTPRSLLGVVKHADAPASPTSTAPTGAFGTLFRSPPGDPRSSSANALISEFLGDYVYAVATRTYGAAVWNDSRNGSDCPAIDAWRASLQSGSTAPPPPPQQSCAPSFGNSDIYGGSYPDPTP